MTQATVIFREYLPYQTYGSSGPGYTFDYPVHGLLNSPWYSKADNARVAKEHNILFHPRATLRETAMDEEKFNRYYKYLVSGLSPLVF